jgi:phospholipid/cholesterol/gamma-HCH transport system permease protein
MVGSFVGHLGRKSLNGVVKLGDATMFGLSTLLLFFAPPWQGKHFVRQMYAIGVGSLVIIIITGAFTGM